ncbi:MAG: cytochrome C [Verrucomicrobia bacterium CG_4_10_14_3_um_filter_43_23]|nr:MAG: cytochrome C [Verrucomicrobia bacterium CG1_02_43_26]PIP58745.1 MAG: cytochrome C [Verrucomicrobia bacterium CG22_combo_CG10-13_8_21_14_all_43_17]PIX58209.1 MAG: cytochrome C [Verrucomicrobia bacterium CG_4_10_14_3_um_filter_43_23]PIY61544.1 MAG: cytochrome C [Verrucomicrobia bacterium CG_4_10_14_0_8_um_filter_43_34]PJA44388.1 MAG: cytochrome C [Verrucomicrobia bacterium CG_4_9_14_3_um_filter_43_20]
MANIFPKWSNSVPRKVIIALILLFVALVAGINYYLTPKYANVGYEPTQPVDFEHSLHVGQLGMDCRYCHTYVDRSEHSNIPATQTCMNCHNQIKTDSDRLAPIRASYESGKAVQWVKVHHAPEYVYFNHAVHVNRGVSCVECHGKVNEMKVVYQDKSLSMTFCLDCHRNPENFVRPLNEVYNLDWKAESPEKQKQQGLAYVHDWKITPPVSCSGCHR